MFRTLAALSGAWLRSLRTIADLHPAVFSVSNWSASHTPAGARQQHRPAEPQVIRLEAEPPIVDMRAQPITEQRSAERAASKLIVKRSSSD
jgi:hypothetical protein